MRRFSARLRGSEEVPRVRTNASGVANFQLSNDSRRLRFTLVVRNIRNVTQAHIHLGRRGMNGPIVVFLFGPVSRGITVDRGIVTGTLTSANLVGPLARQSLSTLLREMRNGNAYVNVHTEAHPNGEIRGQIRHPR
ncbi:CHRD domain-containing protein [Aneurinibacillus migulanus]|uniref:CHRD domain-containing protein n=1 Tax=Aneurinibacillus migulanus TaxID=47500 RepID=UPI00209FD09C|nr:CHRD domain-containing protein [Aneurinibacillus migulanus]MCP1356565.1 CHRD domain-containing protein [Aneurinibacillus migulanus]